MNLLILTQAVDLDNPVLGFFHDWIGELSKYYGKVTVVCLSEGKHSLPANVKVLSLGKEEYGYRLKYILRFYKYIWQERKNYDAVFVHMNQEYLLLGGLWWRLFGKKVFMWRNHHYGSRATDLAAKFCNKVFCTSRFSYTAKYVKTVLMPVGVDTSQFKIKPNVIRKLGSILFLGRISPSKRPDLLLRALGDVKNYGGIFSASFYGDPLPKDSEYYDSLKTLTNELNLSDRVKFYSGLPNRQTVEVYNAHEISVNLSSSGMYDKTIFEAMACGCLVLTSNDNLRGQVDDLLLFSSEDQTQLAARLMTILSFDSLSQNRLKRELAILVETHSLQRLANKLSQEIS